MSYDQPRRTREVHFLTKNAKFWINWRRGTTPNFLRFCTVLYLPFFWCVCPIWCTICSLCSGYFLLFAHSVTPSWWHHSYIIIAIVGCVKQWTAIEMSHFLFLLILPWTVIQSFCAFLLVEWMEDKPLLSCSKLYVPLLWNTRPHFHFGLVWVGAYIQAVDTSTLTPAY